MSSTPTSKLGPIFIVGMNGSGNTMLADCLDNSTELYVFPRETRIIPWLMSKASEFGDLHVRENTLQLAVALSQSVAMQSISPDLSITLADIQEASFFGAIDAVYRRLAAAKQKERWVEKSPMNLQFMLQIAEKMPTAKFIHIFRDGRDVAQSNHRRWNKNPYWSIYRWKKVVNEGRSDGKQLGADRYLEIRYEEFTEEPERMLRQICAFIGIEFHENLLRSSMPFVNSIYGKSSRAKQGTIVPNSQKWRTYFTTTQLESLESISGQLLNDLGYTPVHQYGDQSPSRMQLAFWRYSDIFNQGTLYIKRYGVRMNTPRILLRRFSEGLRYIASLRY